MKKFNLVLILFTILLFNQSFSQESKPDIKSDPEDSTNIWTGAVDTYWYNPLNWYYNFVPDATTDVIIPNVTNKCWVYGSTSYCNNITVEGDVIWHAGSGYK